MRLNLNEQLKHGNKINIREIKRVLMSNEKFKENSKE